MAAHRLLATALAAALSTAGVQTAQAQVAMVPATPPPPPSSTSGGDAAGIAVLCTFLAADVGFAAYDGAKAGSGALPSRSVGIAEAVVASPQVLAFGVVHGMVSSGEKDDGMVAGFVLAPGLANSLFIHGVWAAQTPADPAGLLLGVSAATGFDTALTISMMARAGTGKLSARPMAVMQMVLTAPQVAASAYELARGAHDGGAWAGLTAWSGGIFAHGVASLIAGSTSAPSPEPETPPERPRLQVPSSVYVGPAAMAGGGGMTLRGRW